MHSLVIEIAIIVNQVLLDDMIIPKLGSKVAKVVKPIVEADPINLSVIIASIFFLFEDLYFFL